MQFSRGVLAVALLSAGLPAASSAGHALTQQRNARPGCPKTFTVPMVKRAIYWTYRGTRDVSRTEQHMVSHIVQCERFPRSERYVAGILKRVKARWKERRYEDSITPYGEWAIPGYIVYCESTYENQPPNSAGASGYYQIVPSTWAAYGGLAYAPQAYLSSKTGQDVIAGRIWAGGAGASQWTCA